MSKLTPRQARFVEEYMIDLNATQASIRAGYSAKTAEQQGPRLLGNVGVAAAIAAAVQQRSARTEISADMVLKEFWSIASADPRELMEFRRSCCRYCWGKGFRYQRTAGEMERDREQHKRAAAEAREKKRPVPAFDAKGGVGYHAKRDPHPECPECFGDGIGEAFMHDTRRLSAGAARLYAGVKQTKDGLEVKTLAQADALVNVGRHLGMFKERHEHSGPGGKDLPVASVAPVFNVTLSSEKDE